MAVPKEIKALFERYSDDGIMTIDHLRRFLVEIQKQDNATVGDAQDIFYHLHELELGLNLDAFFKYLFSDINPPLDPKLGVILPVDAFSPLVLLAAKWAFGFVWIIIDVM